MDQQRILPFWQLYNNLIEHISDIHIMKSKGRGKKSITSKSKIKKWWSESLWQSFQSHGVPKSKILKIRAIELATVVHQKVDVMQLQGAKSFKNELFWLNKSNFQIIFMYQYFHIFSYPVYYLRDALKTCQDVLIIPSLLHSLYRIKLTKETKNNYSRKYFTNLIIFFRRIQFHKI